MIDLPNMTRRGALAGLTLTTSALPMASSLAHAATAQSLPVATTRDPGLQIAAQSPWLVNAVALAPDGTMFLGLPRFDAASDTPSLARVENDGSLAPFPGGAWNGWSEGKDGRDAFVMVNAIHIFHDGTLWAVDQGTVDGAEPAPGAQKVVRLDPRTGSVLAVLRFGPDILPTGARLNDLRIHDNMLYLTDSGLGGVIVHDIVTNRTRRCLSQWAGLTAGSDMKGTGGRKLEDGKGGKPRVHSDMLELSADGDWLYFMTPTGPVRRIATAALSNPRFDDAKLASLVETIAAIPTIAGTAFDTQGNLYLADSEARAIQVLFPNGRRAKLTGDVRLSSPDAMFIDAARRLFIPASQIESLPAHNDGKDATKAPFQVLVMDLPESLEGNPLGDAVIGRAPETGLSNFYGIEHVAMTVPDHDAAVKFLEEAFEATVLYRHIKKTDPPATYEQVGHINALRPGTKMLAASQIRFANGPQIEIFELEGYGNTEAAGINDVGLVHISVIVDDINAAAERFVKAGGTMLGEHAFDLGLNEVGPGNQNWFGQTPWGTWVEFMTFASPLRYEGVAERWFPRRG